MLYLFIFSFYSLFHGIFILGLFYLSHKICTILDKRVSIFNVSLFNVLGFFTIFSKFQNLFNFCQGVTSFAVSTQLKCVYLVSVFHPGSGNPVLDSSRIIVFLYSQNLTNRELNSGMLDKNFYHAPTLSSDLYLRV